MPKQKTDDLVQLIGSLTRSEKRHFRIFVRRNQASDDILFLKLFDFLDKYGTYDEEKILKKFPDIKKRQLSNLKAHLYKQLLISLRLLNRNYDLDTEIREYIDYARVLYNKGLYRQSLDILSKTKQKAIETKRNLLALEIVEFEKHIESQYITRSIETRAEELTEESADIYNKLLKINEYSNLGIRLYGLYLKTGFVRNEKDYMMVRNFFHSNLPKRKSKEMDFFERINYNQTCTWYYHIIQNFTMSYRHNQNWVNTFYDYPDMIVHETPLYLKALHNLMGTLFNLWHYDAFMLNLKKLEELEHTDQIQRTNNTQGLYYLYYYIHEIDRHFMEGTYTEGIKLVDGLMKIIDADVYNWDDHRVMLFYYKIACLYFGSGDNSKAIDYLNLIINQRNPDYREDIQCFARILNLMAHFELGNERLVEYQIKSVYRFVGKMQDIHEVQREIFRFLRRTPRMRPSQLKQEFIDLKEKLEKAQYKRFERRPFLYLDIISWLECKIDQKTVQEVVREKFLNRKKRVVAVDMK
ncbi:MAG: hypothetical protein AAF847_08255 [Bacteroidota bacterium]